mmetsp:Transcript_3868/g.7253  ORF Transcript_3868/g.7253 Transcript_3868/m.7253 type:complete len:353 (-) Transcript_3868:371-1429(-)|eukprot:CAMPEP_0113895560 /NCGR_PEP_ID=MMETSP0780_2-20120614/17436_1 /TAXON_ID=652834 /ORGANISM="Palpitomonas bilix" /LENGTH=352 /DNA_ID=CAMNT_0000886415 /DNA_START=488 /DNA_END=1546 /DNA_ORIENTATION=+ /assembly_acc=CAM_ASM_000599
MEVLRFVFGITTFIVLAKSLYYMHHIFPIIGVPFDAFTKAGRQMLGFLIVIFVILFSMTVGGVMMFQGASVYFRDIGSTAISLLRSLSGDYNAADFNNGYYRNIGPLTIVVFVLLMVYIILTMFIAIVTDGYEASKKLERISFMDHVKAFRDKKGIGKFVKFFERDNTNSKQASESPFKLGTLYGHTTSVDHVAISTDGSIIATSGADNEIKVWDTRTKQELTTLKGHADEITELKITLDGKTLISSSKDCSVRIWDIAAISTKRKDKKMPKDLLGEVQESISNLNSLVADIALATKRIEVSQAKASFEIEALKKKVPSQSPADSIKTWQTSLPTIDEKNDRDELIEDRSNL